MLLVGKREQLSVIKQASNAAGARVVDINATKEYIQAQVAQKVEMVDASKEQIRLHKAQEAMLLEQHAQERESLLNRLRQLGTILQHRGGQRPLDCSRAPAVLRHRVSTQFYENYLKQESWSNAETPIDSEIEV